MVENSEENFGNRFVLRSHLMRSDGNWSISSHIPNDKVTWNDALMPGANVDYPSADWRRREEIVREHAEFALGMLYFLQNDEAVRPDVRQEALRWGLPKDEFIDNHHFSYEILVREGRRLVGRYIYTEHDAKQAPGISRAPIHTDSVGIADWPITSHDCSPDRRPGSLNDGVLSLSSITRTAQIPYRVMLPKNVDNLLVTVCLSCSHMGWSNLRLEPVFIQLGESAAYAVSLAAELGICPGKLDSDQLVRKLVENQVMVSMFQEFDMAMARDWVPAVQYFGTKGFFDSYEARPEARLDRYTAETWATAYGDLRAGTLNPLAIARKLADEQSFILSAPLISYKEFREVVQDALTSRGLEGIQWNDDLNIDQPVSRGEACRLLYKIG